MKRLPKILDLSTDCMIDEGVTRAGNSYIVYKYPNGGVHLNTSYTIKGGTLRINVDHEERLCATLVDYPDLSEDFVESMADYSAKSN